MSPETHGERHGNRLGRRGFVTGTAFLAVGVSGCVTDGGNEDRNDGSDGDGDNDGVEAGGVGGDENSGGSDGGNGSGSDEDTTASEDPEDSESDEADFEIYVSADGDRLVATEKEVKPGSVSKRAARSGGYRVEFELTDEGVRAFEEAVEGIEEREDAGMRVEYGNETVFDGPIGPSLWQYLRTGEYSDGSRGLSVTGLDEEEADEIAGVMRGA